MRWYLWAYTLAKKKPKKSDFQNAVIPQPVGGFLFSTPEMKARVAYVPFLLSKPINKMEIWIILEHEFQKISNNKYYQHNLHWYFFQYISQDKSDISFLFSGLDSRNGTYASLAFISGVENKNPSTGCGITAFWKSDFLVFFSPECTFTYKNRYHLMDFSELPMTPPMQK